MFKYLGMAVLGLCLFSAPASAAPWITFNNDNGITFGWNDHNDHYCVHYRTIGRQSKHFSSEYAAERFCREMRWLGVRTYHDPHHACIVYYSGRGYKHFHNYYDAYRFARDMRYYRFYVDVYRD